MMGLFGKKGKSAEEWYNLGIEAKDPEKKVEYYTKALDIDSKDAAGWYIKGIALRKLGRYEEAIRCYDKALDIDPKDAAAWYNKGIALRKLGRYEEAIRCYDTALDINPKYADAWNNKGFALDELERNEEAIRCYDKALAINPEDEVVKKNRRIAEENLQEQEREKREREERKRKERERKEQYRRASNFISSATTILQKAKSLGLSVTDSEKLLNEAKSLLGKGDYAKAIELANKSKGIAETEIDKKLKQSREETLNAISKSQSALQNAKKLGINTKREEVKLNEAKRKLDEKDFSNATKLANLCKNSLEQKINEYKKAAERSAKQSLDFAYSKMKEAEKLGLNVSSAQDLHRKALSEFDNREYERAIEYAEKCKKTVEDEISRCNHVMEQIRTSKDIVKSIKKLTPIPKAEELVEKAESALKVGNYNNAVKFAKEAEGEALRVKRDYEAYKETTDFIFSIESEIIKTKDSGVKIPESEELIKQARSERNNNHFERAKELAREAKRKALERKEEYKKAFNSISSVKTTINSAKNSGVIVSSVENLLNKAKSSLDEGKYKEAFKLSKQAEEEALRLKENHEAYTETSDFISVIKSEITKIKSSGVKIPKSKELIEQAKSELNKNNFERAKKLAEKAKGIAYERKSGYELAFRSISEAERILKETKNKGVIISSDLLIKSKQAFDNGDYEESVKSAEELKKLVNNREIKYREAREWIKSAESAIERAREFGCDTSEAEELLNRARTGLDAGNYAQAISDASRSEKVAKEIKEKSKPEIEVDLSEKTFQPNVWEEIALNIFNKGNANAKDIEIGLSDEVKVKGLEIIRSLNTGEKRDLNLSFKPVEVGTVPLEISTHFKDFDEKGYEDKKTVHINVGEKAKGYQKQEQIEIIIERAIYDPCKGDFIERALPRMKEWINRYDPSAYWFAISLQNNTDKTIDEWGVELETSSALKVEKAIIEGMEYKIELRETQPEPYKNKYAIGVPKEYGIVIPKGGAQRVYFKLHTEKPKTTYEIKGVFKSEITGEVPIRPKEFKYLCDTGVSPEAVKTELKKTFSEKEAARLALSFKTIQELDRMCNYDTKTEEYQDKLSVLRDYTKGFSEKFSKQVDELSRFMKEEQLEYLDDEYKGKVRRFCTNLVDVWISEFLKG